MTSSRVRTIAFYVVLLAGLVLIVTRALPKLLPRGLATQIGHNSESLLFALTFCALVQFLLPWLRARRRSPWALTAPTAIVCFAAGYGLAHSGWSSTLVTLNEPVIATGMMLLYLSLPRPVRYAPLVAVAVFAFIVIFFHTTFVIDQAESLVPAMLAPLALDVFDRTILEPGRRDNARLRFLWMGTLLVAAIVFAVAARWAREDLDGPLRLGIDYGQRAAEAYWGWLIVHAYFGLWLRHPSDAITRHLAARETVA